MKLSGVNSFYHYMDQDKKYFFFGDLHNTYDDCDEYCDYFDYTFEKTYTYHNACTTIGPLLHHWLIYNNNHDIKTDFYIEESFTKQNNQRTNLKKTITYRKQHPYNTLTTHFPIQMSWLALMGDLLQPCLTKEKITCPYYPNVHVHYADIRFVEGVRVSPFNINFLENKTDQINIIRTLYYNVDTILSGLFDMDGYENMLNVLKKVKLSTNLYHEQLALMDQLTVIREIDGKKIKMHRIAWEAHNHPEIKKFVLLLCEREMKKLNYGKDIYDDLFFLKYSSIFTIISAYTMDLYLLSRMFNQDGKEVFVYAGAAHIEVYALYFEYLNIQPVIEIPVQEKKCLDVPNLLDYIDVNKYRSV